MHCCWVRSLRVFVGILFVCSGLAEACAADAADRQSSRDNTRSRRVAFKLTFANRDLIWHGDSASPAALVYVRPGAQPLATDVRVTTRTVIDQSPQRRYLSEARVDSRERTPIVYAFTANKEKQVGSINEQGRFAPNETLEKHRHLLPSWPSEVSSLVYDPEKRMLYYEVELPGPVLSEVDHFLPLKLRDSHDRPLVGNFAIHYAASSDESTAPLVSLTFRAEEESTVLAQAVLPRVFQRADVQLGSFDNEVGTYLPEAVYRPGADQHAAACATFEIAGELNRSIQGDGDLLIVHDISPPADPHQPASTSIAIDGNFDDWRNVAGITDPRGDVVSYLEYVPDVDLLEFKVAHDDEHIYLYARVAGQVGRTHPAGGRSYFYAYIDVDQDAGTGFLPTRDDECYYGVEIGDDCEVQFEFVDNAFRKAFYGFCGLGGDDNVLEQVLTLGKSQYGRFDANGVERENYKSEYIYRQGRTEITQDLQLGSSDSIQMAVSPDGSEVEIASHYRGFLQDRDGRPILGPGQTIDVAAGMECDSKLYPEKTRWGADSTSPIRGYHLSPSKQAGK